MALPLPTGLTPAEVAFLCEMETVTVVPRQRLESLSLITGPTAPLDPPRRVPLPLWLALLLKRQRRANIIPPPWLLPPSLESILHHETETSQQAFSPPPPHPFPIRITSAPTDSMSPPFLPSSVATAPAAYLPYHWLELGEILLEACADDITDPERVRGLLRDLREVRIAKMRGSVGAVEGGGILSLRGVGAMEVAEGRGFITGVMDGLRRLGVSKELTRREREEEGGADESDGDENMGFD